MKGILYFALALSVLVSCSKESVENSEEKKEIEPVVFSYEEMTLPDMDLRYRKAVIASNPNEKAALVLYLHGGSSKGSDNVAQVAEKGVDSIGNYLARHEINSIFLVPQCPSDKSWGGIMNSVLKRLIDTYVAEFDADAGRIYIFGGSMGGTGTWGMLSSYPGLFAAAMPVAGNPSRCNAESVAATPVFTVMGTADAIMSVDAVVDFINKLTLLGNDNMFETETGWTHEVTCIESYTERRLDWVFNHRK